MITSIFNGTVICNKEIGSFKLGQHHVEIRPMHGKRYKPGRHSNGTEKPGELPKGDWVDTIGKPEDRLMIYDSSAYSGKQYATGTIEEINAAFTDAPQL